jgi:hypothetical protein
MRTFALSSSLPIWTPASLVSSLKAASFSSRVIALAVVRGGARNEFSLALPDSGCGDADINSGLRHGIGASGWAVRAQFELKERKQTIFNDIANVSLRYV